jgi:hypothetical protein
MDGPTLPLVESYQPSTFIERGVAVPFTTPILGAARARPNARSGPDLIVPSPSGGRGVYIMAWSNVDQLCRPTVHDTRLYQAVSRQRAVTPASIRAAARRVAGEGLAGRAAAAAAVSAIEADSQARMVANFLLLLELVRQVEPPGSNPVPPEREQPKRLELRAKRALSLAAPRLGQTPEALAKGLEELADHFATIGVGSHSASSRAGQIVANLRLLEAEMSQWEAVHDDDSGAAAKMIAEIARLTIKCADETLTEARALVGDMRGLLLRWQNAHNAVAQLIARPEWLLDGWEAICLLWRAAKTTRERRCALDEMAAMVPFVPREAGEWVGCVIEIDQTRRLRRTVQNHEDWRTGSLVLDTIAMREQLRALAA